MAANASSAGAAALTESAFTLLLSFGEIDLLLLGRDLHHATNL
jgi:hypothetical protein